MRKTTISLALGALSWGAAAEAQTSVTLYGLVDSGVEYLTNVPDATGGRGSALRVSQGGMAASRFGLRGSEDLGGGMKAVFRLENGFAPDNGLALQANRLFGRFAYVGLTGAFGELTLGRQRTMLFEYLYGFDPMAYAGYGLQAQDMGGFAGRLDNSVRYSWSGGGLQFSSIYSSRADDTLIASGEALADAKVGRAFGAGGSYTFGDARLALLYDRRQGSTVATRDDSDSRYAVALSYKLDGGALMAGYSMRAQRTAAFRRDTANYWAGGKYRLSPSWRLLAGVYHANIQSTPKSATRLAAALSYQFSKRTDAYVSMSHVRNRGGADYGVLGVGTSIVPGASQTGVMTGIRTTF